MQLESVGKITKITKKSNNVKIEFSCFDTLIINEDSFTNDYYYVGKEITKKEYIKLVETEKDEQYLKYAIKICSNRLYTKKEIINKLKSKGAELKSIDRIVKKLEEYRFINDSEYIKEYKYYHESKGEGKEKILHSLRELGIKESLLKTLNFPIENELIKAKSIVENIAKKHIRKSSSKQKEAIISTLIRKGYSYDIAHLAFESLNQVEQEENEIEKCKRAYQSLKSRGANYQSIINKLIFRGFKYETIKKVVNKEEL